MKIVHVITRLIIGGAQENTLLSCEGQHDLGHQVTLITGPPIGPEGSLLPRARRYGYDVRVIDAMRRSILPGKDFAGFGSSCGFFARSSRTSYIPIAARPASWADGPPIVPGRGHGGLYRSRISIHP